MSLFVTTELLEGVVTIRFIYDLREDYLIKMEKQTMDFKKNLVFLVAFVAVLAVSLGTVSAFATIGSVDVNGVRNAGNTDIAAFAGETIPVRVTFGATENAEDVRIKAWLSGSSENSYVSGKFDVIDNKTYSRLLSVTIPFNIDVDESLTLYVLVENQDGVADSVEIDLTAERESYLVEILDIAMNPTVSAGNSLVADVVLKNRGRQFAEDTFVRVTIPALGVEKRLYFGDISPEDEPFSENPFVTTGFDRLSDEDAAARRLVVPVPQNTPAGIYTIQFEAFNADSSTTVTKKIAVVSNNADSRVVSSSTSKTFDARSSGSYAVTVVNSGSQSKVYDVSFETPSGLTLRADNSVFAVPAGSSKTVNVEAMADKAGAYTFIVNVNSNGELVQAESFEAKVNGKNGSSNATVVLTVILAIIFIVLLVVLIVLLTRKPSNKDEFGESYY
jgi:hypothetical protein